MIRSTLNSFSVSLQLFSAMSFERSWKCSIIAHLLLNQSQQKRKPSLWERRNIFSLRFRNKWKTGEAELNEKTLLKAKKIHLFKTVS